MPFCGLDIHKKGVQAVILSDDGKVTLTHRFLAVRSVIEQFAQKHLSKLHRVALEATTNTWPVVAILQPFVQEVVVSNPLRTKAIAQAKIKTDKVDAKVLAQLLRADFLPSGEGGFEGVELGLFVATDEDFGGGESGGGGGGGGGALAFIRRLAFACRAVRFSLLPLGPFSVI
jgi:hypothetical protein